MRNSIRQISRKKPTQAEADQKFLQRVTDGVNDESRELMVKIVGRYHDVSYTAINQIKQSRMLPKEVFLDNYDYLMGKIKGDAQHKHEHSEQVMDVYSLVPEAKCSLRTAPLPVRRKAMVALRMLRLLEEEKGLPEGSQDGDYYYSRPSPSLITLGLKNWSRLDEFMELMLDDRELTLAAIDMIMEHNVPTPILGGSL